MKPSRIALVLAGLLAAAAAAFVAAHWAPDRPVATLIARWAAPPSVIRDVAGLPAHVRDEGVPGDPLPIVLLHGTSASLHTWDGWVAVLTRERRVVRVDLPGFGLTGPRTDGDYRIERYVEFVTALLDSLGIGRCVLAGNSFGGWVAWETALANPDRVQALLLVDSAGYPLESQSVPIGFRIASMPLLSSVMASVLPRGVIESSLRNTYGDPSRVSPELVDRYFELTLREGNRAALAQRFAAGRHSRHTERIRGIAVPTLILWGGRDRLIPPSYAERFHRDIRGSRLVLFPDLGHVPHEEEPGTTVAAALEFLRGTPDARPGTTTPPT